MRREILQFISGWLLILPATVHVSAGIVDFDSDPAGNPVNAPPTFSSTMPLRTLYAAVGVTFSGPAPLDGGAILVDFGSSFGVPAYTPPNFLAFNTAAIATMQNGGTPRDPETLTFDPPVSVVSIFASGGSDLATFRMDAFDAHDNLLAQSTMTNARSEYAELSVAASTTTPITRVTLTCLNDTAFVYDYLTFTAVPEPTAATVSLCASCALAAFRRRSNQPSAAGR